MDFTPNSENRRILNSEFQQEKYQTFRKWYFKSHTSEQLLRYKDQYYQYLEEIQDLISFPHWYLENCPKNMKMY